MKLLIEHACNDVTGAIEHYGHKVQSLAFVYLKNPYDAEDIAQEVFITYMRKAPHFATSQKEKSWLLTVTANRCKSFLRSKQREELPLPENLSYLPSEESRVMQAVLGLEEKCRLPIHLHYYEGYSLKEIAKFLGCTTGTVGSWLARGRDKLKQELEEDYFDE